MHDTEEYLGGLLEGWGTPQPRPDFVDRVLRRIDGGGLSAPARRRWRAPLVFALGGLVGGLVGALLVGVATNLGGPSRGASPSSFERITHLQAPGFVEVVGEPGSQLLWRRREGGEVVVEVVDGVAWVRRATTDTVFELVAGGDPVDLGGVCTRVEVLRSVLGVEASVDDVPCGLVEAAIERARVEPSRGDPR